jgi:hypothetical protein
MIKMIKNESFEDELDQIIQIVKEANTDNFFELAEILGRNPKTDLAGANLPNCDLSGGDLEGANLRKTNLSSANLRGTNLRRADLSYSDISGADFTDADLTGTNFHQVQAENAIFCNNLGLYERLRLNLIDRGAIVSPKNPRKINSTLRTIWLFYKHTLIDKLISNPSLYYQIAAFEIDRSTATKSDFSPKNEKQNSPYSTTEIIPLAIVLNGYNLSSLDTE